jgi:diaminopimelate decarboxylase
MTLVRNCLQRNFPEAGDELVIAGKRVTELYGSPENPPIYLYSREAIVRRVEALKAALPSHVHLHYAMKANPHPQVVALLRGLTQGLDVASGGELRVALDAGAEGRDVSFAGPGKTDGELRLALGHQVLINCESEGELKRIARLADDLGVRARVAIRVNPDFQVRAAGMKMGGGAQPFGVDAERVPDVLSSWPSSCEFCGFHIFSGSQNLNLERIDEALMRTVELAMRLATRTPQRTQLFNLGGGWGVPYFQRDEALSIPELAECVRQRTAPLKEAFPDATVAFELGRFLVAEAGVYVARITDIKRSRGRRFYILNGGLNHHLAASGNFGQVIRKNFPIAVVNRLQEPEGEPTQVVGPLCTPLDLLADQVPLPDAEPGDLVGIFQSGAYGATASPINFLGHPYPRELLL